MAEAITGDAGTLVDVVIALSLFLPSQAKAPPHSDTPSANSTATDTFLIADLLRQQNILASAIASRYNPAA